MNPAMFFNDVFIRPFITILVGIYHLLVFLHIPSPLGFSIILLTIIIRFVLYPFTASQLKASKKMQALNPHLTSLKEKHKGDAKRIQQETMRLYKEHGVNPAAGCLPMIIQLPVIWAIYSVFQNIVRLAPQKVVEYVNSSVYISAFKLSHSWDQHFFGIPIGQDPSHLVKTIGYPILLVPILTGVFQLIQSKMMYAKTEPAKNKIKSKDKEKKEEDFATAFQTQSLYIFPFMIGFFSYTFPIGLSLYWNTFTIFGILQQHRVAGLGGLSEWIEKIQNIWTKTQKKQ